MLAGCANSPGKIDNSMVQTIDNILIVSTISETSDTLTEEQIEELYVGGAFIDTVLHADLQDDPRIEFTGNMVDLPSLPEVNGGTYNTALKLGRETGVDAILIPTISRFKQRKGTTMAVDTPAAASFRLRLISIKTGHVLWVGSFDETQQSLMGDLFSIGKVFDRGMKWITVGDMVQTALKNKINECPYF